MKYRLVLSLAIISIAIASPARAVTVAEADTFYAHQDWKNAARAYEQLVRVEPGSPRHAFRLGVSRSALGQWREAIAAYRRAESLGAPPTLVLYNLASVFARASQPDSAVAVLQRLVGQGYFQVERIEQEPHFASIRVLPGYAEVVARARRNDNPCADKPESRQFDFWVGDWDVFDNRAKQPVGSSRIERILGDCVIFENWTGLSGMSGKSINAWNADRRCWQQTWMDDKGGVIHFTDGRWDGERLMFMADVTDSSGKSMKNRLSFFPLGPDEVRQFSEQSRDGGTTWTVEYDFGYRRKKI